MGESLTWSGRASNVIARRLPLIVGGYSRLQSALYRRSGGRRGARLRGAPIFCLTVVGRTSGTPHSVMLMLVRRDAELIVCGAKGGAPEEPQWWKNLVAAGCATAQIGDDVFEVTARVVDDAEERTDAWARLTAVYPDVATYQALSPRTLPIAVLTRRGR